MVEVLEYAPKTLESSLTLFPHISPPAPLPVQPTSSTGRRFLSSGSSKTSSFGKSSAEPPSPAELRQLFIHAMMPMVGFGIMDNFIMIQAGDAIDNTFGATLGIATLTAAAFGQVFSDVSGVLFGGVVERGVSKVSQGRSR